MKKSMLIGGVSMAFALGAIPGIAFGQADQMKKKPQVQEQSGSGSSGSGDQQQMQKAPETQSGASSGQSGQSGTMSGEANSPKKKIQQPSDNSGAQKNSDQYDQGMQSGSGSKSTTGSTEKRQTETNGKSGSQMETKSNDNGGQMKMKSNATGNANGGTKIQENQQGQSGTAKGSTGAGTASNGQDNNTSSGSNVQVNLSSSQQTEVKQVIHETDVQPVENPSFTVSVGEAIPRKVELHPLPPRIVKIVPDYSDYDYFVLADGRIIIVNPDTYEIVYIIS